MNEYINEKKLYVVYTVDGKKYTVIAYKDPEFKEGMMTFYSYWKENGLSLTWAIPVDKVNRVQRVEDREEENDNDKDLYF